MVSSHRSGPSIRDLFAGSRTTIDGPGFAGVAIRILIVEDIEAWHCIYTEVLRQDSKLEVVGLAHNGIEAVQNSRELKPDVVLLDVGLGRTDRLETARQIREVSPKSRILLLGTAEASQLADLAQAVDAHGYISKRNVVLDLVPAMQALGTGKRFRSQTLS